MDTCILKVEKLGEAKIDSPCSGRALTNEHIDLDVGLGLQNDYDNLQRYSLELAGPRKKIYFDPKKMRVGIVTCGGICPGINSVIKSIVDTASRVYGIPSIYGFRFGLNGLNPKYHLEYVSLTPERVNTIDLAGGSILGTSRGPQPSDVIVDTLIRMNVSCLFVIGGDGTMRAAHAIHKQVAAQGMNISVIGVPKTIDNDINFVQESFGFNTAVEKAAEVIDNAFIEASSVYNGLAFVKVMGRESGFIAASAALSALETDLVLIPEVPLEKKDLEAIFSHLEASIRRKNYAIAVVAEGAGQELFPAESFKTDASGNIIFKDSAKFLLDESIRRLSEKGLDCYPKYFSPGYLIRSVPANAYDKAYSSQLGALAVHACMGGHTDLVVTRLNNNYVYIPLEVVTREKKRINVHSLYWRSVLEKTGQPA